MNPQQSLANLSEIYKNIESKQEQGFNCIKAIQELNKHYQIDFVILREALECYPKKQQIETQASFEKMHDFYTYLIAHQQEIQKNYLKNTQQIQEQSPDKIYSSNRNLISKFLKDEVQHYHKIFDQIGKSLNEQDKALNGNNVPKFIQQLYETPYTVVMKNGKSFFDENEGQQSIKSTLKNFYYSIKQHQDLEYHPENYWILQQEILDLLEFWARQQSAENLFVLYARTKKLLNIQTKYISSQENRTKTTHPTQVQNIQQKVQEQQTRKRQLLTKPTIKKQSIGNPVILDKYRVKQVNDSVQRSLQKKKKKLTKQQQFNKKLNELFQFACKRRYPFPAGRTFDAICQELKTMNLEKFINFCNYYNVNTIFSRQLLIEMFKTYALNLRTLDLQRFKSVMQRMVQADNQVLDCFLRHQSPQQVIRKKQKNSLSGYKYQLRPVAGKDISALDEELRAIKKFKIEEKNLYKQKKKIAQMQLFRKHNKTPKYISNSILPQRTNLYQLEKLRDYNFKLEKLLLDNDSDPLLDAYQAKFYSRNDNSMLGESAVDKRIQQGQKVIKRMASEHKKINLDY